MKKYLELIRIKHWIKNILIFLPMICAKKFNFDNLVVVLIGFLSFSFTTSFVYIINDIRDLDIDRLHPRKKNRPIASGIISKKKGLIIALIMLFISLTLNFFICDYYSISFLLGYIIINILYSYGLKNIAFIDILLLASCYILRVYYGASIIDIEVSKWLFLTIMSAAFFLGFGKRKKELLNYSKTRTVLKKYNANLLNIFQYICLCLFFIFYSLWAFEQTSQYLIFTIPLLMLIFIRYSFYLEKNSDGDPITILYTDILLFILCLIYGIIMIILILVI